MLVVMAIAWMVSGHMGMNGFAENPAETTQSAKAEQILPSAPEESPEHQH